MQTQNWCRSVCYLSFRAIVLAYDYHSLLRCRCPNIVGVRYSIHYSTYIIIGPCRNHQKFSPLNSRFEPKRESVFHESFMPYGIISTHTRSFIARIHALRMRGLLIARHAFRVGPGWPGDVCRAEFGSVRLGSTLALAVHTSVLTEPTRANLECYSLYKHEASVAKNINLHSI